MNILITGVGIFLCRIVDVSLGTVRTITTVQGRPLLSFCLGLAEVTIWVAVVSTVVLNVRDSPLLILFYAGGFATGNVVGILIERKMALGFLILRVITRSAGKEMADRIRCMGQVVTVFTGEGMKGPVSELYIVCRRRDIKQLLSVVMEIDTQAFYITEHARDVSKVLRPMATPPTGWRAVLKKK